MIINFKWFQMNYKSYLFMHVKLKMTEEISLLQKLVNQKHINDLYHNTANSL